jgi:hypothetical protein
MDRRTHLRRRCPARWIYRIEGGLPTTLRAETADAAFLQPIPFPIDLHPYGVEDPTQMGEGVWKTGIIPLDLPDYLVEVFNVKFFRQNGLQGLEIGMEADPAIL